MRFSLCLARCVRAPRGPELHACRFDRSRYRHGCPVDRIGLAISEVGAGASASGGAAPWPGGSWPRDLLELLAGRHLLGEQRGLDAVEQALEPADELGLGDAQLGLASGVSSRRTAAPGGSARRCRSGDSAAASSCDRRLVDLAAAARGSVSSSGAARTSSSSCLIIEPMRMTLAGCSTVSVSACATGVGSRSPGRSPRR